MRRASLILLGLVALVVSASAPAFGQSTRPGPKVAIDLLSETATVQPGATFMVAVRQRIDDGWHTYWSNPGDSGEATRLTWTLPEGFVAGDILWPIPKRVPFGPLMNFGYRGEILLLTEIRAPEVLPAGPIELAVLADYLVCADICIPESGESRLKLMPPGAEVAAGGAAPSSPEVAPDAIAAARQALPIESPWPAALKVSAETLRVDVGASGLDSNRISDLTFFPAAWGHVSHPAPIDVAWHEGGLSLGLTRGDLKSEPLDMLAGLLVLEEDLGDRTVRLGFEVAARADAAPIALGAPQPGTSGGGGGLGLVDAAGLSGGWAALAQALLFAVLGGLILNLMPCVFPVLSLKALAIARKGGAEVATRRAEAMAYGAGVLASFAAMGIALVVLRQAGLALGWGFQFQSPLFVLFLAVLFLVLGLSLSGVFTFGGSIAGVGSNLAQQGGLSGSFFTGVLASIASTPCTAPFMGAALGYALSQPPAAAVAVVLALGIGFALPMVLLGLSSRLASLLPRPGPWMETLKQALAFPLYATVGWLLWVMSVQSGSDGVLAGVVALTGVAFAAWLIGLGGDGRRAIFLRTGAVVATVAALLFGANVLGSATPPSTSGGEAVARADGPLVSQPFTAANLSAHLDAGRPVFINLTAAWCVTCKVNEQVALKSDAVAEAFDARGVVYLVGDWTRQNPEITAVLQRHGRVGVPLYLLYSGRPGATPEVLPQILTEAMLIERVQAL